MNTEEELKLEDDFVKAMNQRTEDYHRLIERAVKIIPEPKVDLGDNFVEAVDKWDKKNHLLNEAIRSDLNSLEEAVKARVAPKIKLEDDFVRACEELDKQNQTNEAIRRINWDAESQDEMIDALSLSQKEISVLEYGLVKLVDCMPRLVKRSHLLEEAIVRSARTSFGSGLKTPREDKRLVKYLVANNHTSPLESVKFSFTIRCPKFVAIQLIRHRTANINEFSQRYAEIEDDLYHHPSKAPNGIRLQDTKNKQGSTLGEIEENIARKMLETEALVDKVLSNYHDLISLGVAKEVARFCLPIATYTDLCYTMDLNNLVKFLRLRLDHHAQYETRVVAQAMYDLVKPLCPTVFEVTKLD